MDGAKVFNVESWKVYEGYEDGIFGALHLAARIGTELECLATAFVLALCGLELHLGLRVTLLAVLALAAAGMATALWHHFVASSSTSCNLTLADRIMSASGLPGLLPDVFEARASCADAAVRLFGVPYQLWSLALFVTLAVAAVWLLARRP